MHERNPPEARRPPAIVTISAVRDRGGAAARGLAEAIRSVWREAAAAEGDLPEFVVVPSGLAASERMLEAIRPPLAWIVLEEDSRLPAAIAARLAREDAEGPPVVRLPAWSNAAAVAPAAIRAVAASLAAIRRSSRRLERAERRQRDATDTVRRMDRELVEAARMQREFLPRRLPRHRRLECSVLWRPACHVSGDIYDLVRLGRDRIGVFIADAVGHGLPAAMVAMGLARRLQLRESAEPRAPLEPAEVLRRLNEELVSCRSEMVWFATAAYALFDLRRGEVTVASAGHPPPLLLRPGEAIRPLETRGGLLGIFPRERFEQRTEILAEDDRLLLHSDGFEPAFPADPLAGDPATGYLQAFSELDRCATAADMRSCIAAAAASGPVDESQRDDLTLICLRFGTAAATPLALPQHRLAA
jgi:serine phosphatase RsbU (regulator of sigma subunit)